MLRAHALQPSESYTFELSAEDRLSTGRRQGVAQLTVATASRPWGGSLQASATSGVELSTRFTLQMAGWATDSPLPLEYRFLYTQLGSLAGGAASDGAGGGDEACSDAGTPLTLWGQASEVTAGFTAGKVIVSGLVRDSDGGCATASLILQIGVEASDTAEADALVTAALGGRGALASATATGSAIAEVAGLTALGNLLNAHPANASQAAGAVTSRQQLRDRLLARVQSSSLLRDASFSDVESGALAVAAAAVAAATTLPAELTPSAANKSVELAERLVGVSQASKQLSTTTAAALLGTLSSGALASDDLALRQRVADATKQLLFTMLLPAADEEDPVRSASAHSPHTPLHPTHA